MSEPVFGQTEVERLRGRAEYFQKERGAALKEVALLREAFDVPGLTGVWAYRERGTGKVQWSATVIRGDLAEDEDFYDTPWEALAAAKDALAPGEGTVNQHEELNRIVEALQSYNLKSQETVNQQEPGE